MLWYMGEKFDKKTNKTYKTLEGGLKAAEKNGMNLYDDKGNVISKEESEQIQESEAQENAEPEQEAQPESTEPEEVSGVIRRVFNGKLRLRRSASWEPEAACGVTMFTEKKVTHRLVVDGEPMYKTADGYFISGKPEHVEFVEE